MFRLLSIDINDLRVHFRVTIFISLDRLCKTVQITEFIQTKVMFISVHLESSDNFIKEQLWTQSAEMQASLYHPWNPMASRPGDTARIGACTAHRSTPSLGSFTTRGKDRVSAGTRSDWMRGLSSPTQSMQHQGSLRSHCRLGNPPSNPETFQSSFSKSMQNKK